MWFCGTPPGFNQPYTNEWGLFGSHPICVPKQSLLSSCPVVVDVSPNKGCCLFTLLLLLTFVYPNRVYRLLVLLLLTFVSPDKVCCLLVLLLLMCPQTKSVVFSPCCCCWYLCTQIESIDFLSCCCWYLCTQTESVVFSPCCCCWCWTSSEWVNMLFSFRPSHKKQ